MAIGLIPIITTDPTITPTLTGLIAIMIGEVARMEPGVIPVMTAGAAAHGMEVGAGMGEEVGMAAVDVGEAAAAVFVGTAGFVHDPIARFRAEEVDAVVQADVNGQADSGKIRRMR